jgi:multidrug efflux pump
VVGGMVAATSIGIFLIPVLFVVIERLAEKWAAWKQRIKAKPVIDKQA